jgi:benzoyl-CoA reductase subunit C
MDAITYYKEAAESLSNPETMSWKNSGRRIIGIQCSAVPEEIIHAAGMLPMRIRTADLQSTKNADAHLHRINCSYTRSMLELLLEGKLDFLDGFVTANNCDHHLRLAGEIADKSNFQFIHYFQPNHTYGPGGKEWLLEEMKKLIDQIEETFGVRISKENLRTTIAVYNTTRRLMGRLSDLRKGDPPLLTGTEYIKIAVAGMTVPRERFNEKLELLLPELERRQMSESSFPRLLLLGGGCDSYAFVDFIENKGARVVADGLCFGGRHYMGFINDTMDDPLEAIAERYLARIPCPAVIDGFEQSYAMLKDIIDGMNVQGIVVARLKFCDHFAGARKLLADQLRQDQSIPLIELEREYSTTRSGQLSTRIQAFLEML